MALETSFTLKRPTYTDEEIKDTPWNVVRLKVWDILAATIESPIFKPVTLAEELNGLFPTNRSSDLGPQQSEPAETFLWRFWGIIVEAAGQVPVNHPGQQRLVELLTALRDLPNPIPVPGLQASWGKLELWSDLPIMGLAFREALNGDISISFHAFIARISAAGLSGFWFVALYYLKKALETQLEPRATAYDNRGELLDKAIPNAALWIRFAGTKIHEMSLAEEMRDTTAGQGGSWNGQPGFSMKRWDSWKRKFGQVSGDEVASQETRDLAAQAKDMMDYYSPMAAGTSTGPGTAADTAQGRMMRDVQYDRATHYNRDREGDGRGGHRGRESRDTSGRREERGGFNNDRTYIPQGPAPRRDF